MTERGAVLDKKYPDDIGSLRRLKVIDHSKPKLRTIKGIGEFTSYWLFFSDGSSMPIRRTVPKNQEFGVSLDFTFPLGTNVRGFNSLVAKRLAEKGVHSRSVGTNTANERSLSYDAWLTLLGLDYDDALQHGEQDQTCDASRSVSVGYSMALLKALIMEGHAPELERDIDLTLGLDPGPIEKVPRTPKEAALFAWWNAEQIIEIPKIGYNIFKEEPPRQAIETITQLALTLSLAPKQLLNTLDRLRTISKGETSGLLDSIPPEAVMIIHFFNSRYNQKRLLAERLGDRPNVRLKDESGVHISGADPQVLNAFIAKAAFAVSLAEEEIVKSELAEALDDPLLG